MSTPFLVFNFVEPPLIDKMISAGATLPKYLQVRSIIVFCARFLPEKKKYIL